MNKARSRPPDLRRHDLCRPRPAALEVERSTGFSQLRAAQVPSLLGLVMLHKRGVITVAGLFFGELRAWPALPLTAPDKANLRDGGGAHRTTANQCPSLRIVAGCPRRGRQNKVIAAGIWRINDKTVALWRPALGPGRRSIAVESRGGGTQARLWAKKVKVDQSSHAANPPSYWGAGIGVVPHLLSRGGRGVRQGTDNRGCGRVTIYTHIEPKRFKAFT